MREDLEYLAAAHAGRMEMLGAIFGTRKNSTAPTTPPAGGARGPQELTPAAFDRMFPDE